MLTTLTYFKPRVLLSVWSVSLTLMLFSPASGQDGGTYLEHKKLVNYLFDENRYDKDVRPLHNQSLTMHVHAHFELVSIVEVDDVHQKMVCNGFFVLYWSDEDQFVECNTKHSGALDKEYEMLTWNASEHNDISTLTPSPSKLFRPRLYLLNTLEKREGEEIKSHVFVNSDGFITWTQGVVYTTSCQLTMTYYPFDHQICKIELVSFTYLVSQLQFFTYGNFPLEDRLYMENREWDVLSSEVYGTEKSLGVYKYPLVVLKIHLRRKPVFLVLTVLIPIILISFLNVLVFVIPQDTGDKVSYSVTVLLALAVYMSMTSAELPRSSEPIPLVIAYILTLLVLSVLSVLDTVAIVILYHCGEMEESPVKNSKGNKANQMCRLVQWFTPCCEESRNSPGADKSPNVTTPIEEKDTEATSPMIASSISHESERSYSRNKYKAAAKCLDRVSLLIFSLVWFAVNIGFMVAVTG